MAEDMSDSMVDGLASSMAEDRATCSHWYYVCSNNAKDDGSM